jgi:hypothetical protein
MDNTILGDIGITGVTQWGTRRDNDHQSPVTSWPRAPASQIVGVDIPTPVLKERVQVLKKAGIVTAAAVALSLIAAPAFAATTTAAPQQAASASWGGGHDGSHDCGCADGAHGGWGDGGWGDDNSVSFPEAYGTFIWGGGALGAGAAALVAGAYAGLAATPADILGTLEHHHHG